MAAAAAIGEDELMFDPKNLFPLIALAFALAAGWRLRRVGAKRDPAARTWLLMAAIFGFVSVWLHYLR
jgi:hypothetical protein